MQTTILPSQPDKKTRQRMELGLAAGLAALVGASVFVFRPGGTTSDAAPNVYPTWAPLAAAAAKVAGPKIIQIDTSVNGGTATIPAGSWALSSNPDVEIRGNGFFDGVASVQSKLVITDGATFPQGSFPGSGVITPTGSTCIGKITSLDVVWSGVGTPPVTLGTGLVAVTANYAAELVLDDVTINATGTTSALIQTAAGAAAAAGLVEMRNGSKLTGGLCIAALGTSTLTLECFDGSSIAANTLGTAAGATIALQVNGGSQAISLSHTGNLGTLTPTFPSKLAALTPNRQSSAALANAGVASPAGPAANPVVTTLTIVKTTTGHYRVKFNLQVATNGASDITLTIQARATGGVFAAVYTLDQTTSAAETATISGEVDFDGTAFPVLPASAAGSTDVSLQVATSAGATITTVAGHGCLIVEEG
jgi:hypothetical protein